MMNQYIATFHTHFAALRTAKNFTDQGISARMAPVPRSLSTSCGTCLRYEAKDACLLLMHEDYEGIYLVTDESHYSRLYENE